jgi:hypothetical protein
MGKEEERVPLIRHINDLFSARNIQRTADRVKAHLELDSDIFEILHALDCHYIKDQDIPKYRHKLPVPHLHKRILTLAFRTALLHKRPLKFNIKSKGGGEAILVKASDREIEVELTRPD